MAPYKIYDDCHNSVGTEKKLVSFSVMVTVEIRKLKVISKIRVM